MTIVSTDRPTRVGSVRQPYVIALLVALALNLFSGQWGRLGISVPLDRVAFGFALVLLVQARGHQIRELRLQRVHVLMLAFVALAVGSAAVNGTLVDPVGFFALLDRVVVPFALFVLAPLFFPTVAARDVLLRALMLIGLYLGAMAVVSVTGPTWLLFPSYISDPEAGIGVGRARGPSLEAVGTGLNLIICGFAAALVAVRERGPWRAAAVAAVALALVGVTLSQTRSIWLGAALALVVAGLADRRTRHFVPLMLTGGVVVVGLVLVLLPDVRDDMLTRLTTQRSIDDRTNTNLAALEMLRQQPLTGIGWSRFVEVVGDYVRQADLVPVTNVLIEAHNVFLSRAAELGVPGVLLWTACVVLGPVRAMLVRPVTDEHARWRLVALGAGTAWLVVAMLTPLPYPLPNSLTWLIAGIVVAYGTGVLTAPAASREPRGARSLREADDRWP